MAISETIERLLTAVNERNDALLDAARARYERRYRLSQRLIEEVQRGQRDAIELGKKWAEAPLDLLGFYGVFIESLTRAQGRALEFTRDWFRELAETRKEAREIIQRLVRADRTLGETAIEMARGAFTRAAGGVTPPGRRISPKGDGARPKSAGEETAETKASD